MSYVLTSQKSNYRFLFISMKQIIIAAFGLTIFLFSACSRGQENIKTPENAMSKFEEFKRKEKFF